MKLPSHRLMPPASRLEIAEAEAKLHASFPASLVKFLLQHNGGWLFQNTARLYSVGDREYSFTEENERMRGTANWPPGFISFGTDGGLGLFCFDKTSRGDDGECNLYYWSWEERQAELVGRSFPEWLVYVENLAKTRLAPG
jgi:cell wall assembly regulator SMI1